MAGDKRSYSLAHDSWDLDELDGLLGQDTLLRGRGYTRDPETGRWCAPVKSD